MKWIKSFENFAQDNNNFVDDTNRGNDAQFDHSNSPVIGQKAKEYVDKVLHSNDYKRIFNDLGKEVPKDLKADEMDPLFDEIKDEAVKFYTENPDRMTVDIGDGAINKMGISGGGTGNALTANVPMVTST
jgi:hypothetical protein